MKSEEFDKHIRSVMRKRELQPGSGSWDRVAALLDDHESARPARSGWKFSGVAAAVAVLVAALSGWYLTETKEIPSSSVVEAEGHSRIETTTPILSDPVVDNQVQPAVKAEAEQSAQQSINEGVKVVRKPEVLAKAAPVKREALVSATAIEALPAQYIAMENHGEASRVSDAEVDALLAEAMAQMEGEKMFRNGDHLDPHALLSEVEEELDQNFKNKALEALKHGFVKLRTAVAERNN